MRKGVYWLNLMTRDEQIGWHCWCGVYMELQSYRNFEEFIKNTVMQHPIGSYRCLYRNWTQDNIHPRGTITFLDYWRGIIDKYSSYDNLSPMKYLQPLNFSMTK